MTERIITHSDDVKMEESGGSLHRLPEDYCPRLECIERERIITEQAERIAELES